jgi:hypothetical protein
MNTACGNELRKSSCSTRCLTYEQEKKLMKRVKEACLCQTLHFATKEPFDPDYTAKLVKAEVKM